MHRRAKWKVKDQQVSRNPIQQHIRLSTGYDVVDTVVGRTSYIRARSHSRHNPPMAARVHLRALPIDFRDFGEHCSTYLIMTLLNTTIVLYTMSACTHRGSLPYYTYRRRWCTWSTISTCTHVISYITVFIIQYEYRPGEKKI